MECDRNNQLGSSNIRMLRSSRELQLQPRKRIMMMRTWFGSPQKNVRHGTGSRLKGGSPDSRKSGWKHSWQNRVRYFCLNWHFFSECDCFVFFQPFQHKEAGHLCHCLELKRFSMKRHERNKEQRILHPRSRSHPPRYNIEGNYEALDDVYCQQRTCHL